MHRLPKPKSSWCIHPKEDKKDQTSEETKLDLRSKLQPQNMKLQINRLPKIRNGGIAIEVPITKAEGLIQTLQQGFQTRLLKVQKPKFKIYDVPVEYDADQSV